MTKRIVVRMLAMGLAVSTGIACSDDDARVETTQASPSSEPQQDRMGFPPGKPPDPDAPRINRHQAEEFALEAWEQFEPSDARVVDADELPYASVAKRFGTADSPGRDERVHPSREVWLVFGEGDFHVSGPEGVEVPPAPGAYAIVDAYTGLVFERGTMSG